MRVAIYSPWPPQRSGIADYAAELLPHLARHAELRLICDPGARPAPALVERFPVDDARALPGLLLSGAVDVVLYHLGNNRDYHSGIRRTLLAHPGVVVIHDVVLHDLVRETTLRRGDAAAYVEELRYCAGPTGERAARRSLQTGVPLDPQAWPLFERVVDRSLAVLVHNHYCRDRILRSRPLARVEVVPHHLSLGDTPPGAEARRRLGLPEDGLIIASFGFITEAKRPLVLLRAFARLRERVPRARLVLAGAVSPHFDLKSRVGAGLLEGVTITGRLELEPFLLHMAACDVAVNLRWPTSGETSGTLVRLLGLGKPLIVTEAGAFAELPDGCVAKVDPPGGDEEEQLFTYLERLATDGDLRRMLGENARRHATRHHAIEDSAAGYLRLLREVVEDRPQPFEALPPLAASRGADVRGDLVARVGRELCDLGLREDDPALDHVARRLCEIAPA